MSDDVLARARFPRSSRYAAAQVFRDAMGPHPLWLLEWLCEDLGLERGMRVLDLGCGKALTSVFLAREFGVQVWAADLWVDAGDNARRIREAGCADTVHAVSAEAHALPFERDAFDAIVSIDAYHYFGTDDLYLTYLTRFVKPGGLIGVVVPGLTREFDDDIVPAHLAEPQANGTPFWEPECISLHSPAWWRRHWQRSERVRLTTCDLLPDGCRLWLDWERAYSASGGNPFPSCEEALAADDGDWLGFVRLIAERTGPAGFNLYGAGTIRDPA
jgi:SAM-dependent methyltransferase